MKSLLGVLSLCVLFLSDSEASQIAKKIESSRHNIESTEKMKKEMNSQLAKIADSIRKMEREYASIEKILDRLEREKKRNESRYGTARNRVMELDSEISDLDKKIKSRYNRFIQLLTEQFSVIAAMDSMHRKSEKSVILKEAYEIYKRENKKSLKALKKSIDTSRLEKSRMSVERNALKKNIAEIERKRKLYNKKKKEKKKLLSHLGEQEKQYKRKLKALITRQNMLRLTLAKLNILRKEEIEEAKRREVERQEELRRRAAKLAKLRKEREEERKKAIAEGREADYSAVTLKAESSKVKRYGSSYHKNKIYNYTGPRTISPISRAIVVKKFGTYIDPIYKIKIFNESVTLKAPAPFSKVRNVLNGKVVYIGQNSMLGKVVVVAHGNRLHTVYAGLSKTAPGLKSGSRVKKGAVIGKIKSKLIFEATKESKYIDPLKLIRL